MVFNYLGDNISTIKDATRHVLSMSWIAFHHLIGRLKAGIGDLTNRELFMVSLFRRDDRSISHQGEMNPWVCTKLV